MKCRFCDTKLKHQFLDLINSPASNSFLNKEELDAQEIFYPLKLFVCPKCFLVQVDEYKNFQEIFNKSYLYFSSYSKSWLDHAQTYVEMITSKLNLNKSSHVVEIASNDGYLLQYFKQKKIPCIGIEPTKSTADAAREKGINIIQEFFSFQLTKKIQQADLIIANNVLAHTPHINNFVSGLKHTLKKYGTITIEVPHLKMLIEEVQFDTIYHEHFSYFSLYTIIKIFKHHKLEIYDVEKLSTHGGSLRIYAKHNNDKTKTISSRIAKILKEENSFSLHTLKGYKNFQIKVNRIKYKFLQFLIDAKLKNKKVVAYAAAAKGNTFLNYCGIKNDLIEYVIDKSPHKQGKFLPGSHIPIYDESILKRDKPDYILILAWNIKEEIISQLVYLKQYKCKYIVAIPELEII